MSDWKCTGECRWLTQETLMEGFASSYEITVVLQQLWENTEMASQDWRDVPVVKGTE